MKKIVRLINKNIILDKKYYINRYSNQILFNKSKFYIKYIKLRRQYIFYINYLIFLNKKLIKHYFYTQLFRTNLFFKSFLYNNTFIKQLLYLDIFKINSFKLLLYSNKKNKLFYNKYYIYNLYCSGLYLKIIKKSFKKNFLNKNELFLITNKHNFYFLLIYYKFFIFLCLNNIFKKLNSIYVFNKNET